MKEKFSIQKMFRSFRYACNGVKTLFAQEQNARIHLFAAIVVVAAGFIFQINKYEWIAIACAIGLVLVTETINTAIENLADYVSPAKNEKIKIVKDLAAAAVLISAVIGLVIGILVFGVRLVDFFY